MSASAAAWQRELALAVRDPRALLAMLDLDPALLPGARRGHELFRLRVPRGFVRRMRRGDAADPLLRQVLPLGEELAPAAGFATDPLGERRHARGGGLLQKYRGRALLLATGACAVHCRYCFRRHFPYAEQAMGRAGDEALAALRDDASVSEVILSGGDPLSLPDERLAALAARLDAIPHLRRLRLHTRLPVVLPERVDEALTRWLGATRLDTIVVLHANHANEIDAAVVEACRRLAASGARLLNQSVLLKSVNDSVEALADLSEALFAAGVLPYYLHLLDRVQGAAHFEVDIGTARRLAGGLAARLPGYLVPRLVREVPGASAKQPVAPKFSIHSADTGASG